MWRISRRCHQKCSGSSDPCQSLTQVEMWERAEWNPHLHLMLSHACRLRLCERMRRQCVCVCVCVRVANAGSVVRDSFFFFYIFLWFIQQTQKFPTVCIWWGSLKWFIGPYYYKVSLGCKHPALKHTASSRRSVVYAVILKRSKIELVRTS